MSEKFTKGPWKATYDSQLQAAIEIYNTEDRVMVAVLPDRGTVEAMSEIEANANLIAAAPDMYEALEEVIKIYSFKEMVRTDKTINSPRDDPDRGKIFFTYNDLSKARNALRKARGESE